MSKIRVVLISSATFVAGAVCGGLAVAWFLNAVFMEPSVKYAASAGVATKVTVLDALRAGETEKATTLLEGLLDGDILTLSMLESAKQDETVKRVVSRAAEYRYKNPYRSGNAEVDRMVQRTLSQRSTPTNQPSQ